jgi:hypothetical protein
MTTKPALPSRPRRWLCRLGLAAPALLLSLGCAKMSDPYAYAEAPAMPEAQTVDITGATYYDEDGYDFSDDLAKEGQALSPAEGSVLASRNMIADGDDGPPYRTEAGEPSTTSDKDQTPDHGRQIIYVAGMQVSVYNLESAIGMVESMPERFGGWVHMRNQSQVVLRLPADRLKPAMAELATLGVVEARTLQAQDVTAEYVDLDSRIKVLRETQTQLLDLLGKAKTVEEALHVRRALDQVTMELEVALGRMRQLSDLIAYSTLTVTLVERGPQDHIPTSNDPFGWVDTLGVEATEWR